MHPTPRGVAPPQTPHVDVLHTLRIPRTPKDSHYLHRLVATLTDGAERPLWAMPRPGVLIIRSPHLTEVGLPARAQVATTTALVPDDGSRVEWALVASPCKTEFVRGQRGTRRPLPAGEAPEWAARKLAGPLSSIEVTGADLLPALPGRNPKTGRVITHHRYAINGTAVVTDQKALVELLAAGVGPGKAFGCGLLIVKEVADG